MSRVAAQGGCPRVLSLNRGMAERTIAPILNIGDGKTFVGSNPTAPAWEGAGEVKRSRLESGESHYAARGFESLPSRCCKQKEEELSVTINPGSGPAEGDEESAMENMEQFVQDLRDRRVEVKNFGRIPEDEQGGRFPYEIECANSRFFDVDMPGVPLEQVRFLDAEDQNIGDFPRIYVDGISWVWKFALNIIEEPVGN